MAEGVGIYLGTRSIDLVHVTGTFRTPRLVAAAHIPLDRSLTDDPAAITALAEPLQRLARQEHAPITDAHIGIPADTAIIRYFQMPTVPPQDRVNAARFEAKKYHPFKLQELNADAHIVILRNDPTVMRVMFYAVKKDLITQYLHTLQAADIQPRSVETSLTSLMRATRRTHQLPAQQAAVLISVDHDTASVAIVQQDLVYLARNVTLLPGTLEGAPVGPESPADRKSGDVYDALVNNTVVSVDYYRRRFPNEPPVTKVFVNSETVSDAWLQELSAAVELPVERLDAGRDLTSSPQRLTGNAAVALGLALRGLEPGRHGVNLLPQELQPKPRDFLKTLALEAAVAGITLLAIYQFNAQPLQRVEKQIVALQHPNAPNTLGLSAQELTPDRLQQRYQDLMSESSLVRSATTNEAPVSIVLNRLAALAPDSVWLRRFAYHGADTLRNRRDLTIDGSAYHPNTATALEAINIYAAALNREELLRHLFGSISLTAVQRSADHIRDVTDFHLVNDAAGSGGSR